MSYFVIEEINNNSNNRRVTVHSTLEAAQSWADSLNGLSKTTVLSEAEAIKQAATD